jgi:hypothetical protein
MLGNDPPHQWERRPGPHRTAEHQTTNRSPDKAQPSKAVLEYVGAGYDDVLVLLGQHDVDAAALIRQLPTWAREKHPSAGGVWRVHPGFAGRLRCGLRRLGRDTEVTRGATR